MCYYIVQSYHIHEKSRTFGDLIDFSNIMPNYVLGDVQKDRELMDHLKIIQLYS